MIKLAREAIVSVKDAEEKAKRVEMAAREKAETIIESAREEVDQYEKRIIKEMSSKSRLIVGIAKSQANKKAQEYLDFAREEFGKLDDTVKNKKKEAIKLIVEQVV